MKTLFALMLAALAFVPSAYADTCNCSVTGQCVCRPGTCQCPTCPGRLVSARRMVRGYPVAEVYAVPVVVAPQYVAPAAPVAPPVVYYYQQPAYQPSGGCYWNGQQWVCPNSLSGGQRRALRRAERRGLFDIFGWGE